MAPTELSEALALCRQHPVESILLADWLWDDGLRGRSPSFRGTLFGRRRADEDQRLESLVLWTNGGLILPLRAPPDAADALRTHYPRETRYAYVLLGARDTIHAFQSTLLGRRRPRLARDQLAYEVTRRRFLPAVEPLRLHCAEAPHFEELTLASARMAREEIGDDPHGRNPELFRERLRRRMARKRDFVHFTAGQLLFKANVAALCPFGGHIEGIYTRPDARGQGLGHRGTTAVTQWVLENATRATLLVNEDNDRARRLYERHGYREMLRTRTVFLQ